MCGALFVVTWLLRAALTLDVVSAWTDGATGIKPSNLTSPEEAGLVTGSH